MKILSKYARLLGKKGGQESVKKRFGDKNKSEISKIMKNVRKGKK